MRSGCRELTNFISIHALFVFVRLKISFAFFEGDDIPTSESKNKVNSGNVGDEEKVKKNNKKNKKDGKIRKKDFVKRNILVS